MCTTFLTLCGGQFLVSAGDGGTGNDLTTVIMGTLILGANMVFLIHAAYVAIILGRAFSIVGTMREKPSLLARLIKPVFDYAFPCVKGHIHHIRQRGLCVHDHHMEARSLMTEQHINHLHLNRVASNARQRNSTNKPMVI